jgi:hypothetical protein
MEQVPVGTERTLAEYLFRQLNQLEVRLNDIQNTLRRELFIVQYKFSNSTVDADPGTGFVRIDNAAKASATIAYISQYNNDNIDLYDVILGLRLRDIITLSEAGNITDKAEYYVTGIPTVATNYFKIPLLLKSAIGAEFVNNNVLNIGVY